MSKFIASGFQSLLCRIVSYSSRQIRSVMAAAGYGCENDLQDDAEEDANDARTVSDSDEAESHTELANGNSATGSPSKTYAGSDVLDCGLSVQQRQSSESSSPRITVLGREKDCSLGGMLFAKDQPKRQFHFSLWSSSDKGCMTRGQMIKDKKGEK